MGANITIMDQITFDFDKIRMLLFFPHQQKQSHGGHIGHFRVRISSVLAGVIYLLNYAPTALVTLLRYLFDIV